MPNVCSYFCPFYGEQTWCIDDPKVSEELSYSSESAAIKHRENPCEGMIVKVVGPSHADNRSSSMAVDASLTRLARFAI